MSRLLRLKRSCAWDSDTKQRKPEPSRSLHVSTAQLLEMRRSDRDELRQSLHKIILTEVIVRRFLTLLLYARHISFSSSDIVNIRYSRRYMCLNGYAWLVNEMS